MPITLTRANSFFIYSSFLYIGVAAPKPSFTPPLSILLRIHCIYEVCPYYKDTLLKSLISSSLSEPRSERYIITKSLTNHAVGSRICIRAVSKNTKIPHAKTVPSTIDNIAPLRFVVTKSSIKPGSKLGLESTRLESTPLRVPGIRQKSALHLG